MLEIDGSEKSGSGTILRLAIAFASILRQDLHIYNIRKKRSNPGLRPQHLEAVLTAAKLTNAKVKGTHLNSQELWFEPKNLKGGTFEVEIGTAGSIPMLFMTVLPICLFSETAVDLTVKKGGTDVKGSPTINYMKNVFLKVLDKMGAKASITVKKYGYYPVGKGEAILHTEPSPKLNPVLLEEQGKVDLIKGISVSTFLKDRKVSERQATAAERSLYRRGYKSDIEVVYDESNPFQKGSSMCIWTETDKGTIMGGDAIGEIGKQSETVGSEAADNLLAELDGKVTMDMHMADMIIPYVSLIPQSSHFVTRRISDHLQTNIWVTEKILGTTFNIVQKGSGYMIQKK